MQPPPLEPETRYCPRCRVDRPHHHKVRYTRPALNCDIIDVVQDCIIIKGKTPLFTM